MAASPPVCLDEVNTMLYRLADWQMTGFVAYERLGQLKMIDRYLHFFVCLCCVWWAGWGVGSGAVASSLYSWCKAPAARKMRGHHLHANTACKHRVHLDTVMHLNAAFEFKFKSEVYFWVMRRAFPTANNNFHKWMNHTGLTADNKGPGTFPRKKVLVLICSKIPRFPDPMSPLLCLVWLLWKFAANWGWW